MLEELYHFILEKIITQVNQNLFMGWRSEWIWVQIHFQPLTGLTLGRLYNLVFLAVNLGN